MFVSTNTLYAKSEIGSSFNSTSGSFNALSNCVTKSEGRLNFMYELKKPGSVCWLSLILVLGNVSRRGK